jgi:hypothetical protein
MMQVTSPSARSPLFVVQNGNQIDVHYRDHAEDRERTVVANVSEEEARRIVAEANSQTAA